MLRTRTSRLLPLVPLGLCLACGTLTIPQERDLGAEVAKEMRRELRLVRDPTINRYVRSIGQELVRAAGPQPFEYHFYVVEDNDLNAFAAPGGYVYVNTGTILEARNVSELAGVIAHEVGHVNKRHVAQNYNRSRNTGLAHRVFVTLAGLFYGGSAAGAANVVGGLAGMAYVNTFTREAETEADAFAVETMPRARYDPHGLVSFFVTIQRQGGAHVPKFLSSHPATEDRIAATSAAIANVPPTPGLRIDDRGKLEIIQRRIRLLTGDTLPESGY